MALPDSYTLKPGSISAYFDAILQAQAPDRFSVKFLEGLEFKSTNDRTLVGILKDLGFLDADAVPTKRYYEFLDRSQSGKVLAAAIRDAYADLFAVNKDANKLSAEEVKNKLRTLYAGAKKDGLIGRIASTFTALSAGVAQLYVRSNIDYYHEAHCGHILAFDAHFADCALGSAGVACLYRLGLCLREHWLAKGLPLLVYRSPYWLVVPRISSGILYQTAIPE